MILIFRLRRLSADVDVVIAGGAPSSPSGEH
jgi:hypothetical protein